MRNAIFTERVLQKTVRGARSLDFPLAFLRGQVYFSSTSLSPKGWWVVSWALVSPLSRSCHATSRDGVFGCASRRKFALENAPNQSRNAARRRCDSAQEKYQTAVLSIFHVRAAGFCANLRRAGQL